MPASGILIPLPIGLEVKVISKILEAIFYEHAELSEWLGSNVETIKTSRFDDIVNGIDVIAEFSGNQETSHLGLAIDATLSNVIEEKLERIKKEIDEGHLAEIKYFYSEELNIRQPKKNLPRVIICVEAKTIKELSELWMENKNKELGQHQIQYQILEEIILQLETFKNYVEQKGFSNLAEIYEKDLEIVKNIYQEKKASDNYERDSMFELLKSSLKDFKDLKV